MRSPLFSTFVLLALLASCAQDDAAQTPNTPGADSKITPPTTESPTTTTPTAEPTTPTAEPTTPTKAAPRVTAPAKRTSQAPPELTINQVTAAIVSASTAENELGKQVEPPPEGAVAIDLQFASLPGRALDPVLEIGGVTFRNYETRPGGVLRFVVAGPELAEAGAVVLRWGEDAIAVAEQLQVTR